MLGWLHSVPQPPAGSERAKRAAPNKMSRIDRMKADNVTPQMPPNPMPHFVEWFFEIGIVDAGGMGPVPLSWRTILDWQDAVGIELSPWEAKLMRDLSVAYVTEKTRGENETCPAPWRGKVTQQEVDAELKALIAVLG